RARTAAPTPSSPPETTTGLRGQLSARARAGPPFLRGRRGSGSRHPRRGTGARRSPEARSAVHGDCTLHTAPLRSTTACAGKSRERLDVDGSSVRLRLQPHPSFGCASHLQGTRESRNRWARPPSAGRRAASRRVEKAITKNPAPSAATTKSARAAAPRRGWAAKTGSHRGRGLRGCAEGPRAPQRSGQLSRAAPTHRASLDPLRAPLRRGTARWEEYVPLYCGQFPTAAYMRSTGCWNREQSHCSRRDAAPASRTAMLTLPNDNSRIARAAPGWLRHGAEVGRGRVNDFRRGGGGGEGRRSIDLRSRGHGAPRFRVASRRGHGGPNPPLPRLALLGFGGGGRGCLETRSVVRVASPWVEGT
ncbi:unnamed protein product, partial [Prorocentrum cordatum]